jgi:cytochrome c oxidase assembly protein subunit 15
MTQIDSKTPSGSDLLVVAFGATTAMWAVLWVCLMPGLRLPGLVVIGLISLCPLVGGWILGRYGGRSLGGGAVGGLFIAAVNFLVTASLIGGQQDQMAQGYGWVAGFSAVMVVLTALGTIAAKKQRDPVNWIGLFPLIMVATTTMLIAAGGIVTSLEAGMAVPDWPNTFGYGMIFYPLTLLQRDGMVYAEHTHRLWGMLVGLTSIVLLIQIWRGDSRRWVRFTTLGLFAAVCLQGYLGGSRVTLDNLNMAMVHGISGQLILAWVVVVAVGTSNAWRRPRIAHIGGQTDRWLLGAALAVLIAQLVLGAMVRHLPARPVMAHVSLASLVLMLILASALRVWGLHGQQAPVLRFFGIGAAALVIVQVILGVAALLVTGMKPTEGEPTTADVIFSTAHQFNGALLLGAMVALAVLAARRIEPTSAPLDEPPTAA